MRKLTALPLALLAIGAIAGCGGQSEAEKNAAFKREVKQDLGQLKQATRNAAQAGVEAKKAEEAHRQAVETLKALERAEKP